MVQQEQRKAWEFQQTRSWEGPCQILPHGPRGNPSCQHLSTFVYTSGLHNWEDSISGVKTTLSLVLCRTAPGHSHHHVIINSRGKRGQEGYRVTQDSAPALPHITTRSHLALLSNKLCPCSPGPQGLCLLGLPPGQPGKHSSWIH